MYLLRAFEIIFRSLKRVDKALLAKFIRQTLKNIKHKRGKTKVKLNIHKITKYAAQQFRNQQ
jgi:hypothetical protein